MQEKRNAQFFGGTSIPAQLLQSLFTGHTKTLLLGQNSEVSFVHMSPLDAYFEFVASGWAQKIKRVRAFSATTTLEDVKGCNSKILHKLLQDFRSGEHALLPESQIKFDDTVDQNQATSLTLTRPELSLAKWSADQKQVSLSIDVRNKWAGDPVFGAEWQQELRMFDNRLGEVQSTRAASETPVPAPAPAPAPSTQWPVQKEVDALANFEVVKEFPPAAWNGSPQAGVKLMLVKPNDADDAYGLFAVGMEAGCNFKRGTVLFNFGPCDWQKPPKGWATLSNPDEKNAIAFVIGSDADEVILEILSQDARKPEDTDVSDWRSLLFDLENTGHINVSVWGHVVERPQGAVRSEEQVDRYTFTEEASKEERWACKWRRVQPEKADENNCGSVFSAQAIEASPLVPASAASSSFTCLQSST